MITLLKLASVSAVLSAGVVGALEAPRSAEPASAKIYQDRLASEPANLMVVADASGMVATKVASDATAEPRSSADCRSQTWPYLSVECVTGQDGAARRPVRTITIEKRTGLNTSTLVRVPLASN